MLFNRFVKGTIPVYMIILFVSLLFMEKAAASSMGYIEKLHKVKDLPSEEIYTTKEGQHLDIGIKYTLFQIAGIPLFRQGEIQIIGYIDKYNYLTFTNELLTTIAEVNNIENIQDLSTLPFRDAWGGKIVIVLILVTVILAIIGYKRYKPSTNFSARQ